MTITWSKLTNDSDRTETFQKILEKTCVLQGQRIKSASIAQLMLACALSLMDYTSPEDTSYDFKYEANRGRMIRFGNFIDYVVEFVQKRQALMDQDDHFLEMRSGIMQRAQREIQTSDIFDLGFGHDIDDMVSIHNDMHDFCETLITQGYKRLSLSKALIDLAFTYAKDASEREFYALFCNEILDNLSNYEEEGPSLGAFADMNQTGESVLSASNSVH